MTNSAAGDEEAAPFIAAAESSKTSKNHNRDIHILSLAFLFVFSAYGAAQNLESTVNDEGDLGTTSLGILYLSFTLFSVIASQVVRWLGSKNSLVLGTSGYLLFIAANLKPTWYTMVPASVYMGFSASIIWVGQGTYLTTIAISHANDNQLHEATVIGSFNGEFWMMFAGHQVIGNLIALALLGNGGEGGTVTGKNLLFTVFLGCMILGIILMCALSKRDDKASNAVSYSSPGSLLIYLISPLLDVRMLLIIPLIVYSGLQQAFVWSEFTKDIVTPALGVSGVGGAMAVYGVTDAICSLVAGRLTSGLSSITLIVSTGAFVQMLVLVWLLWGYSLTTGVLGYVYPLIMAGLWGIGDGVLNTQMSALLAILFKNNKEAAFAQLKVWQCAAIAISFFVSPYISLQAMLISMAAVLCIAVVAVLILAHVEKAFSSRT